MSKLIASRLLRWLSVALVVLVGVLGASDDVLALQVFSDDLAGWTAAAGGPVVLEDFSDAILVPGFVIVFGSDRPGTIEGGEYHDRANDGQLVKPTLTFAGPGATAFGMDWFLDEPSGGPGTGIRLFVTFTDATTETVATEIPRTFTGEFFGIVSNTIPIASIRLDEGTQRTGVETFDADNARMVFFATPSAQVPAPASLVLLGFGGAAVAAYCWRRPSRATP